jgi:hypothetical protein
MNKTQYFLKKHSSTILTVVGATGVVGTAVLAVKATPKALLLLEEAKKEKQDELTPVEVVKVAWKPYIPAILVGSSTIACIFGANYLNTKNQASLMSAYALLDSSFKEYRAKVNEIHGEDADIKIVQEVASDKFDENMELEDDKLLFFDYQSIRFFESTMDQVLRAETEFLELLHNRGYACLNEYYDLLGLPHCDFGYQLGWYDYEQNDPYECEELEFNYEETTMKNGGKCWVIDVNMTPTDI